MIMHSRAGLTVGCSTGTWVSRAIFSVLCGWGPNCRGGGVAKWFGGECSCGTQLV